MNSNAKGRSKAALQLAQLPVTLKTLSETLGVAITTCSGYRRGEFLPSPEVRAKIEQLYGIEAVAWDQAPGPLSADTVQPEAEEPVTGSGSAADQVRRAAETSLRQIRAMQARVLADPQITDAERARVLDSTAKQIKLLGGMVGLTLDLSERQLVQTPAWRVLEARIVAALAEHPAAAQAVRDALVAGAEEQG